MIIHRLAVLILGLFLAVSITNSSLLAAETDIPLPKDAIKVSEKSMDMGPVQSTSEVYQSYLSPNRINAFFKKELTRLGWAQNKSGVFIRNGRVAVIAVSPLRNQSGAVQFMVITSKIPDSDQLLAERKEKPDKLDFMPAYPGCIQNFLWDTPTGVSGSYETDDDVKDVIFFYKSKMLNYGWALYSEVPIKEETVKYPGQNKTDKPVISTRASLRFHRKGGESCVIMITSISDVEYLMEGEKLVKGAVDTPSVKTTILIVYNERKKINQ